MINQPTKLTFPEDENKLLVIRRSDGDLLLSIAADGTVQGAIADSQEAGRIFAESVAQHLGLAIFEAKNDDV